MKMWPISFLHLSAEMGQGLMSSQLEKDLEHRSPSLWGSSDPLRAGGRAGKADLPGGKRQQVGPLSSPGSFFLLKP